MISGDVLNYAIYTGVGLIRFGDAIDIVEIAEPDVPGADTVRLFAVDDNGNTRLQYKLPDETLVQVARDNIIVAKNLQGGVITKGQVVYISGGVGASGTAEVKLARADAESTMPVAGIAMETSLDPNEFGRFMVSGLIQKVDTDAFTAGARLYASESVAGALTATPPTAPDFRQRVAVVINKHQINGSLLFLPSGITTPVEHALTHYDGGSDPVDISSLAGFPLLGGSTFLDDDGNFSTPAGGSGLSHPQVLARTLGA
jgi:hypothetical protein